MEDRTHRNVPSRRDVVAVVAAAFRSVCIVFVAVAVVAAAFAVADRYCSMWRSRCILHSRTKGSAMGRIYIAFRPRYVVAAAAVVADNTVHPSQIAAADEHRLG